MPRTALFIVWTLLPFNSSIFVGVQLSTTSPHHDARFSGSTTVGMQLVPWSHAFDSWSSTKWLACDPGMHPRRPFTHLHPSCKPGESKGCWHISAVTLNNFIQVVNQSPREHFVYVAYPKFLINYTRFFEKKIGIAGDSWKATSGARIFHPPVLGSDRGLRFGWQQSLKLSA